MKEKSKVLTIIFLLILSIALIATFSQLDTSNSLSLTPETTPTPTAPFSYSAARESSTSGVLFENNFGGNNNDIVCQVCNLEYYYIIGNTNSTTHYFNGATVPCLFVIKMSRSGMVINVKIFNDYACEYANSVIGANGIYIGVNGTTSTESSILLYNFSNSSLTKSHTWQNATIAKLYTQQNSIYILTSAEGNLILTTLNLLSAQASSINLNMDTGQVILFTAYKNGSIIFLNKTNGSSILFFSDNKVNLLDSFSEKIETFTPNSTGYLLILQSNNNIKAIFYDFNFNKVKTNIISRIGSNFHLQAHGNNIYAFYKTQDNALATLLFSSSGDLVFNFTHNINTTKLYCVLYHNSGFHIIATNLQNNLQKITLNEFFQFETNNFLPFNAESNLHCIETNLDGNLMLFGMCNAQMNTVKNNFGNTDIFVIKYLPL